ncbi:ribonucleoside-triphosphate reductase class III activase subunit [Faecalicatena contorta]|uniref:Anaerobic ribonucleoside-triphosphate reductase-activating protein n=2 Tax=Faecalicatena contorta TaxID=39482 RepID=A0A316A1Z9_9FIRM|nr:ribonucleoside-triphosphate reductase class III activase subunit [Faecalicatena contorta]SUQ13302.1 ribonucleoside-triphosphate reductase class III activase subunit [Faecalicatena contorta]
MTPRWRKSQKGKVCSMQYHNITKDDMLNGDGLRVVLWVAGCSHGCRECHNPVTWDPDGGLIFDQKAKKELFEQLEKDYISGITYSGGDPLFVSNRACITKLSKEISERFPDKTQWLYTGYEWDEIKDLSVMKYLDVVVDGKFEIDQKDTKLHWKGSGNQKVINVQDSLGNQKIVLHDS